LFGIWRCRFQELAPPNQYNSQGGEGSHRHQPQPRRRQPQLVHRHDDAANGLWERGGVADIAQAIVVSIFLAGVGAIGAIIRGIGNAIAVGISPTELGDKDFGSCGFQGEDISIST
jgi:hypothetical protein